MAAAFAIDKIGDFISSCIELAAKADGIRTAFNRLNDPSLLSRLREATQVGDVKRIKQGTVEYEPNESQISKWAKSFDELAKTYKRI